jgi:hypothetical protein
MWELGLYLTKLKMPTQKAALIRDDGSAFKNATGADVIVDSPSSYIKTTDLYLGGLYNFKAVGDITPYVGLGYAKVKGNWYKSYWRGYPGLGDSDIHSQNQLLVCILNCNQKNGHWKFPHHRWWHLQSQD